MSKTEETLNYVIYTDGSCLNNPGPGGYAAILMDDLVGYDELVGGEPHSTNNRMELMAAIVGLENCPKHNGPIKLYSDSTYVINGITKWIQGWKTKGWRKIKNRDLWERLDRVVQTHNNIEWIWVRGHNGTLLNEKADKLAVAQAEKQKSLLTN